MNLKLYLHCRKNCVTQIVKWDQVLPDLINKRGYMQVHTSVDQVSKMFGNDFVPEINWLIDWLIEWLNDWMIDWVIEWLIWAYDKIVTTLSGKTLTSWKPFG